MENKKPGQSVNGCPGFLFSFFFDSVQIKMRIVNFLQAVVILHRTIHFFFQGIKLLRGKMIGIKKKLIFQFIFLGAYKADFCVKSAGKYFEVSLSNSICSFFTAAVRAVPGVCRCTMQVKKNTVSEHEKCRKKKHRKKNSRKNFSGSRK